jgi:protein ImuB
MNQPEIYACLYVKEFPAQAILRLRPELHGKPCVVMQGEPPSQTACSLNTKARILHLAHGMTQVEVDTFPNIVVLSRSLETEISTRAILREAAGTFSPRVEEQSHDTAFLSTIDISGTQGLFGPPELLARCLVQRVKDLGITSRVVVSSNVHTSICLAKDTSSSTSVRVILPQNEAAALASLPVAVLDPSGAQAETFALWGIHTLGMLAALPEKELIARMGQDGKRLRQLALGIHPHFFQPAEPPFSLAEKLELDSPVDILESLLFVAGVMLDQLILRATSRVLALASITLTLSLEGGARHTRTVRPALPTTDKQLWIKLLHLDLEANPPAAAVLMVALEAEPGSTSKVQLGLFSPQLPEAARLDLTLARIRALVGEDGVGRAALQDTHAPDHFIIEPFTIPSREPAPTSSSVARSSMRQLRPPEPTIVTLQNAQPATFLFRDRHYIVEKAYGPWLIQGDWWTTSPWGQEQWDLIARSREGQIFCGCMVRDLLRNHWLMAYLYD